MTPKKAKVKGVVIVRDRYGRIVVDDSVFHDKEKLEMLRQEVIKNGSNASSSNS